MHRLAGVLLAGYAGLCAATLEKLSIEQMSQHATAVVRGRVQSCGGEMRGSVIYTVCKVRVSETWKGSVTALTDVSIPGGTAKGLTQTFPGTPALAVGDEYVLFLWAGKSGRNQVIGLTQGVFDVSGPKLQATANREASGNRMLDAAGRAVADEAVRLEVRELRRRVQQALEADAR